MRTQDRRTWGLGAYRDQWDIPEEQVLGVLTGLLGEPLAEDSLIATGGAWQDGPLRRRDRSIAVIASMIAIGGVESRLASHLRWGLRNGLSPEEMEELIRMLASYVGYPRATMAMELYRSLSVTDGPASASSGPAHPGEEAR